MKPLLISLTAMFIQISCVSQSNRIDLLANNFLNSLNEQERAKATYALENDERYTWHYIPKDRKGIPMRELSDEQKNKALALLKSCLSTSGYTKTMDIIQLENVLKVVENQKDDEYRNPGKYYITIFGKPDQKNSWGWRFEGHHVSFSFSAMNNSLKSGTPGFLGANPAVVETGPQKGKQVLKEETETGFALLHSFTKEQLQTAVSKSPAPNDIITLASRKANIDSDEGIDYAAMTKAQQTLFLQLIEIYIHRYTKLFADDMIKEMTAAGLNKLRFVWAGTQQSERKPYYYRIQGPTIIIEFDNSQGNANHIHTVVRDLKNDFGGDELLEHYKKNH